MRTLNFIVGFTIAFCAASTFCGNVASAQSCSTSLLRGGAGDYQAFVAGNPATVAFVQSPSLGVKPTRLRVGNSSDFYPLPRLDEAGCAYLSRTNLRNSIRSGYLWFVLNNSIALADDTDLNGRSYLIVQIDRRYSSNEETSVSISRNTSKRGQPSIWEREGHGVGGIRPTIIPNMDGGGWNEVHRARNLQEGERILDKKGFKKRFHATPVDDDESTWEARTKLIVDEGVGPRKLSNILISFLAVDAATGNGSGVPFQFRPGNIGTLQEIRIRVRSDLEDLTFENRIQIVP